VARFYGAFSLKPRGKSIIRVCLGTACYLKGGGKIADAITSELGIEHGERTKDGKFTFEHVHCLGACALSPVVTVNDKYYANMNVRKVMGIIKQYDASSGETAREPSPELERVTV
jgi:NADH:ubiquinone oxidoreductase subunit E